jgi:valyl-tRNA synthetase
VLDRYLRLLHPVMPHLTEEIWQRLPHLPTDPELLIVADWPTPGEGALNDQLADAVAQLISLVGQMRTARAEAGIEPGEWLPARIWLPEGRLRAAYADMEPALARLARVRPALAADRSELEAGEGTLSAIAGPAEATLSRSGADLGRERARLARELEQARGHLAQTEARLADAQFVDRAPSHVVEATKRRADDLRDQIGRLSARLDG